MSAPRDGAGTSIEQATLEGIGRAFTGSPRTKRLLPVLRRMPSPLAIGTMAALAVADGVVRGRFGRALAWAASQELSPSQRYYLATALLVNHGRFVAQESMLGIERVEALRAMSVIEGADRLDASDRGALLIGLHLGPPRSWLYLRAHGYPVRFAVRDSAGEGPAWRRMQREGIVIPLPLGGEPAARVEGLYRLRRFLRDRGMVFMAADGPLGSPLFTLDVPGPPPVVRGGWFHLRRQLRAPTFPTLMHESSGRRIVTVHPALPDVEDDPERDAAACRDAMSAIVREYVRRWPAQCRYLAFPPWASNANPGG